MNTLVGTPFGMLTSSVPRTAAMDGHEGVPLGASAVTGKLGLNVMGAIDLDGDLDLTMITKQETIK